MMKIFQISCLLACVAMHADGTPDAVGKQLVRINNNPKSSNLQAFVNIAHDRRTVQYAAYTNFRTPTKTDVYDAASIAFGTAAGTSAIMPDVKAASITFPSARVDKQRIETIVNEDNSYQQTIEQLVTLLSQEAVNNNQSTSSPSYYPHSQSVKLIEAYTLGPDGTKYPVRPDEVFVMTAPPDPNAPGFITATVQQVAFPHLEPHCKVYSKWLFVQEKQEKNTPFADVTSPFYDYPTISTEFVISIPKNMYMQWATSSDPEEQLGKGGFVVTDEIQGDRRIISAVLGPQVARVREVFMPAASDSLPYFQVSGYRSWGEVGTQTWDAAQPAQTVTPQIQALVKRIIGTAVGKAAANLLYDWVTKVPYLATMVNPKQGYTPIPAQTMLYLNYGDCKDHSNLFNTFLKVLGIGTNPVLVNWNNSLKQYPLPVAWFDHAMLYIPQWDLYCNPTNNMAPFGSPLQQTNYDASTLQTLSSKPVVICQQQDSPYLHLPTATPAENQYHSALQMVIDTEGNVQAVGAFDASGSPGQYVRGYGLAYSTNLDQWLTTLLRFNGINGTVSQSVGPVPTDLSKPINYKYAWAAAGVVPVRKEKIALRIPMSVDCFTPASFAQFMQNTPRQTPIIIGATNMSWTYEIKLPDNYVIEHLPDSQIVESDAGFYRSTYQLGQDRLLLVQRQLVIQKPVYQPYEYPALLNVLNMALQDWDMLIPLTARPKEVPYDTAAPAQPGQM